MERALLRHTAEADTRASAPKRFQVKRVTPEASPGSPEAPRPAPEEPMLASRLDPEGPPLEGPAEASE